jgi:pimeloyl-ACP methyl ester carboxylesterase
VSILTLSDGRSLEYLDNGVQSEKAILFLHGTPGDATVWNSWLSEIASVRAIATSRPGYGLSDRQRGRTVAADIANQQAILDLFKVERFVSIGWSGGGPHSLNMARDHRCVAAFTIAGVGEFGREDLDFLEGMGPENHDEFGAAIKGEPELEKWMERNGVGLRKVTGPDLISAFGGLLGDADKRALTPAFAEMNATTIRRALEKSFDGWIDDDLAFVRDFGFDLKIINKPVMLWQGDDDFMVPQTHSAWLARQIPGSTLRFVPGHGHISLVEEFRPTIISEALNFLR